jgi:MFS family permease
VVFAFASLVSGPVTDRVGPRRVIFAGILIWALATIGSALSTSFPMLLAFRALVGVGEGAYGPSANMLLCAAAAPERRGRALGIYNLGMAFGGVLATFGASGLIFWARWLIIEERHFSLLTGSLFMAVVGLLAGAGGVVAGG